jgi:hypothetical protein
VRPVLDRVLAPIYLRCVFGYQPATPSLEDLVRRKLPSHQPGGGTSMADYDLRRRSREACIRVRRETTQAAGPSRP